MSRSGERLPVVSLDGALSLLVVHGSAHIFAKNLAQEIFLYGRETELTLNHCSVFFHTRGSFSSRSVRLSSRSSALGDGSSIIDLRESAEKSWSRVQNPTQRLLPTTLNRYEMALAETVDLHKKESS